MGPKLVYTRQNWPSSFIWRDLYLSHLIKVFWQNVQPRKVICLHVLNLKISITKVTRVSFWNPKGFMLQNLKLMLYESGLENLSSATNDRITFHLCSYSKLRSPIILHLTKINPSKSYEKCFFLFHLNCSFGSTAIFKF